jgi:hypothetical protein
MTTPAHSSPGIFATIHAVFLRLLGGLGLHPSNKWVAHFVTNALTGLAVALLPLGISDVLNGVIVVIAGLVAHYVVPSEPVPAQHATHTHTKP